MSRIPHDEPSQIDLSAVSTDALHAEIARRKTAAQSKGKRMRYPTKEAWARARVAELEATKSELKKKSGTGSTTDRMHRRDEYRGLDEQITKFQRLAASYAARGL